MFSCVIGFKNALDILRNFANFDVRVEVTGADNRGSYVVQ